MTVRTPRGRMATRKAYQHLGKDGPDNTKDSGQGLLFE
jgi:Holliday junction resolvasome RuvABC ATP-dependent DNA helicase subunit